MMDNVQAAMARMATIRSTMGIAPPPPRQTAGPVHTASVHSRFADALSSASGASMFSDPHIGSTGLTPVAGTVRSGPPPGLDAYENGRIPPQALVPVEGTDERLWAPAAAAFSHMRRDAASAGVRVGVVDGYRTHDDQVRLAGELGLYKHGGLAAVPGTSQHGWGRALDLELDDQGVAWMRDNAWKYGFVETVPGEPWHWEFHPAT